MTTIVYDDFKKLDIRTAKIIQVEKVKNTDRLLKLQIKIGEDERQIISGIGDYYTPEELLNRTIIVLTNLEPRKIRGEISNGMLLAADVDGKPVLLQPDSEVPSGVVVR
ncbi:MAG: methionine--tRNA ligase subunit beta [Candidatus Helarchaeota archaeon]